MRCLKMIFGMVCIVFTFIALQEIGVDDTYAIDDLVTVIDSSNSSSFEICSDSSCSSYSYVYVLSSSLCDSGFVNQYIRFSYRVQYSSSLSQFNFDFRFQFLSFDFFEIRSSAVLSSFVFSSVFGSLPPGCSITVTLSENSPFSGGITPSGSLEITENGTYDVTNYSEAVVGVSISSGGDGGDDCDYHDDLVKIYQGIMTCGGVMLVLYFFYCIYRMIIKSTGGK